MSTVDLPPLTAAAWAVREHAVSSTKVGCAVLSAEGNVHVGCNIGHRFRCHDVHAEVNALSSMVAAGDTRAVAVLVVAERELFTPCGSCLDWVFELGGPHTAVAFQPAPGTPVDVSLAMNLMPRYPR